MIVNSYSGIIIYLTAPGLSCGMWDHFIYLFILLYNILLVLPYIILNIIVV